MELVWTKETVKHQTSYPCRFTVFRDDVKGLMNDLQCRSNMSPVAFQILSNRLPLALCLRLVDHILVHLGPEESWVGVSLHETVHFSLDVIEAGWGGILQALLGLFPCAVVNVYLVRRANTRFKGKGH